jgi:hypothetical protein
MIAIMKLFREKKQVIQLSKFKCHTHHHHGTTKSGGLLSNTHSHKHLVGGDSKLITYGTDGRIIGMVDAEDSGVVTIRPTDMEP